MRAKAVGAVVGLAVVVGAGCGSDQDDGAAARLCRIAALTAEMADPPTFEQMVSSDGDDALLAATVIAVVSTTREGDVEDLGEYGPAVDAIVRRGRANLDVIGADESPELPSASQGELSSARAADRAIGDGECDRT